MRRYFLSNLARQDLIDIAAFTEIRWGVAQRDRYMRALEQRLAATAARPSTGRRREELGAQVRSALYGSHLIIYRPASDGIDILRVLHAGMDVPAKFDQDR